MSEKWKTRAKKEFETPKWLKRGTKVIVEASYAPTDTQIEGQYGKRKVYVIKVKEFGLIYISSVQFLHVCEILEQANFENVTVEL